MTDRYSPMGNAATMLCHDCGAVVYWDKDHDAFHARIDRLTDMRVTRGFHVGLQEGIRRAINLIDPEPLSCDCRAPLCTEPINHGAACSCGGVTTVARDRPELFARHSFPCAWADWARREIVRRKQQTLPWHVTPPHLSP